MKTYKKLFLGIGAVFVAVLFGLTISHKAIAAAPKDNYLPDFYAACVVNVAKDLGNDMCTVNSDNNIKYLLYDGLDDVMFNQAHYKASDATTSKTSNGVTVAFPKSLELLNTNNQSLFSGDLAKDALKYATLTFSGNVYNTYNPNSKYSFIDKSNSQLYAVYNSGAPNIVFLATKNSDGTTQVLAEVYSIPQSSSNTEAGTVYAAKINQTALTSDIGGALILVKQNDPCNSGADCVNNKCTKDNGDCSSTQAPTCESNFDSGFEWIICGGLKLADAAAGGFSNFVDDQLCFKTGTTSSTNGVVCHGNDNLNDNVKTAWGIFKNIATALLVIVMLIMVISQAIGGGLFDAYTVRKMMPKLVVAVILMQLSWVLFKWTIDLSNDLGKGVQNLMYAPFGGPSNMQLDKLIGNAAQTHTVGTNNTWAFFTILAGLGGAIANLPGLLTLALFVVVSLATAFFVLILRKILIILLIILAPVALIAWILPGTQRYWKMWQDNFTKLLLMFPMIMALIAGGRIFAYIVSGGPEPATGMLPHLAVAHLGSLPIPYFASVTSFADIAIIVFAFFGPYLLLPKAFTWGGQLMSSAVSQVNDRINKPAMEKGREGVKGISERYHGSFGKAYDPNAFIGKRVLTRLASGHANPFSKRSQRLAIAAGDKWSQEKDEQALAKIKRMGEKVMRQGYETFERDDDGRLLSNRILRDAAGNMVSRTTGAITTDEKEARDFATSEADAYVKQLNGVQAMKQMWVDLAEEGDSNEAKMAVRQLTATSSWPEVQGAFTKSGKRVVDTDAWAPSITTSPEDYPKVLRSRVDYTPHIDNAAKNALDAEIERRKTAGLPAMTDIEKMRFTSTFRVTYAIEKQLDNEGFSTQSDGFWEETSRMATQKDAAGNYTPEALRIQTSLRNRFEAIQKAGPTARQQMLGHLANGGRLEQYVNEALGAGAVTGAGAGATPTTVLDYMH